MGIKHTFVSGKSDSSDTSLVRPSNWNDDHTIDGNVAPDSDNAYSLGISGTAFSDVWIGSGGKIDFATGDATLQHSTDTLTLTDSAFALSSVVSPTALAADADDYAPSGHAAAFAIRQDASADVSITGLAGGAAGRVVALINISSANVISLTDEDTNSTAANRFAIGSTITLDSDAALILYYDDTSSRWRTLGGAGGGKATLSDTAPAGASAGKIWIRTTDFAAFVYYTDSNSSQWVQFGGGNGGGATPFVDSNGNEWLDVSATASAVNYIQIANAATSNYPSIAAVGDDANVGISLAVKGSPAFDRGASTMPPPSPGLINLGSANYANLSLYNDSASDGGPYLCLVHNTASPAAGDLTSIEHVSKDSAANTQVYSSINFRVDDPTSGSEDSSIELYHSIAGSLDGNVQIVSGGISFDAGTNSLDDYEEGTWTPTLETDGTHFDSVSYGFQEGKYTKIGRFVALTFAMYTSSVTKGSASSNVVIGGAPFTSSSNASGDIGFNSGWLGENPEALIMYGGTDIFLQYVTSNVLTAVQVSDVATGASANYVYGSIFFDTTA